MFLIFYFYFERTLYKSNYIIFILSRCGTHTKIRSKLVDIVTAGSQKITLWGPQRAPLGIKRVKIIKYCIELYKCFIKDFGFGFMVTFCTVCAIALCDRLNNAVQTFTLGAESC